MAKNGRRTKTSFAGIPRHVMNHPDYKDLSGNAVKLLLELARQYCGHNNGDLTASWTVAQHKGFKSKGTLTRATKELLSKGMIIQTRQGYFSNPGGRCTLYALTWQPINECSGKDLEVKSTTTPPRKFSLEKFLKSPSTVLNNQRNQNETVAR